MMAYKRFCALLHALALVMLLVVPALAAAPREELRYYLGSPVNAGADTGYTGSDTIDEDDPHFGWNLGSFYVSGYTRSCESGGNPVFLKNPGDTVCLWFRLEQPLDCLNGDPLLTVEADTNGYDTWFGIPKTDFGRGTLIVRHTDYQNHTGDPVICTDYLSALQTGADVQVELFEEGDYEVALNYSVKYAPLNLFDVELFPKSSDYRIFFRFSVRNGNCMVYPFDIATGAELANASCTPNGFYLDLAKSRYLDVDIQKEVLNEGRDGLVEDVRFNRPTRDGEQYTDEGIYTITVRNRYTDRQTTKVIYVGTDELLQAHVTTGLPVSELAQQLSVGAAVADDGALTEIPPQRDSPSGPWRWLALGIGALALIVLVVWLIRRRSRRSILDFDGNRFWG